MTASAEHEKPSGQDVLETIETHRIRMRPRLYFVLRALLVGVGIFFSAVLLLYLVSFLGFEWRAAAFWSVPDAEFQRCAFVHTFPWLPILLMVGCVVLIEWLVRRNPSVYRRPAAYSIALIVLLAVLGGLAVLRTSFHRRVFLFATERHVPFVEPMYRGERARFRIVTGCPPERAVRLPPPPPAWMP